MDGSSRINRVLVREDPKAVVKFILWISPPDRVLDCLSSVKYPNPTSLQYVSLVLIVLYTGIDFSVKVST